jgi:glutaredoxin
MILIYKMDGCPFCNKVINYLKTKNLEYRLLDISEKQYLQELIQFGGKEQVPFMIDSDNNKKMYESDDIIEYLSLL